MAARKKKAAAPAKPRKGKSRAPQSARGPDPTESALLPDTAGLAALTEAVLRHGGAVLATFRDPFAGLPLMLASLPLKRVAETPFQRDLSKTHADKLVKAIGAAGVFLDPIVAVP